MPKPRPQSPAYRSGLNSDTLSRGNCSAYGAVAKTNENWTVITDRAERRRIQNRIAQRAYRLKLKERLQLLERRAASMPSSSPSTSYQNAFNDEACYTNMSSNTSTSSEDQCNYYGSHAISRTAPPSPPQYPSHSGQPNIHVQQQQDSMPYYNDLHQLSAYYPSAPLDTSANFLTEGPHDIGVAFPYLQPYGNMLMAKPSISESVDLSPSFMDC